MSRNETSQARVTRPGPGPDVIVFGQIARDLVLVVGAVPTASRSADVYQRRELLGGKGANQAVGLAQLGMRPALAGVVGEDQVGQRLLTQAGQDRVDGSPVARRPRGGAPRSSWTSSTPPGSGATSRTYRLGCCSPRPTSPPPGTCSCPAGGSACNC